MSPGLYPVRVVLLLASATEEVFRKVPTSPVSFVRWGIVALAVWASPAPARKVALTFDDLPVFGRFDTAAEGELVTQSLLAGFRRHHWKVTGFVNEDQLEGVDKPRRALLLKQWLDAGMDLGNHTYSHVSLSTTPLDGYVADVARDETVTAPLLAARGRRER